MTGRFEKFEKDGLPSCKNVYLRFRLHHFGASLPAPESSHAIKVAIDEAMKCRETGEAVSLAKLPKADR